MYVTHDLNLVSITQKMLYTYCLLLLTYLLSCLKSDEMTDTAVVTVR